MEENKVIRDGYFDYKGKSFRIPSTYLIMKIRAIADKIDLDEAKISNDEEGIKYALMLNGKYGNDIIKAVGIILYGRNFLYNNSLTRPLSHIYRRYKTRQLLHSMTNNEISEVFYLFVTNINLAGFLSGIKYTSAMTNKDNLIP